MAYDPKIIAITLSLGIIPAVIWLWFWMKEDKNNPEPKGLIFLLFLIGMGIVFLVLPLQKFVASVVSDHSTQITLWAAIEEIMKYLVVFFVTFRSGHIDEPIDYPIYMMIAALGFAGMENALFLLDPLSAGETLTSVITGNLRFLGSTLLHAVCSGFIGIMIGLAYFESIATRKLYTLIGIVGAIVLHTAFNFFIMERDGEYFLQVFGFLWVVTIIIILLFEKLRRLGKANVATT